MFMHNVQFDFQESSVSLGLDIENTNISFKLIDKDIVLMNDGVPWRCAREKKALSLQVFIKSLTN